MSLNNKLKSLLFGKLILLGLCLSMSNQTFGQEKYPALIVSNQDTLVAITKKDFQTVLFTFSYAKSLENTSNLTSKQLSRQDSVIAYLDKVLVLEARKSATKDSIIVNLEDVIKQEKKARRKEKFKNTMTVIGLGILAGAEAGVITYLLLR